MSKLLDIVHQCAVACGKAQNMRVTASRYAVEAIEYMKTNEGVMDAVNNGVEPNMSGFMFLVTKDTAYPQNLISRASFYRLLQIGGDEEKDAELRKRQASSRKKSTELHSVSPGETDCNNAVDHELEELVAGFNALRQSKQDEFLRRIGAIRTGLRVVS